MECKVFDSCHIAGKKWAVPIIEDIALERFNGFNNFISRSGGITPKTLSRYMKHLEAAGIVKKNILYHRNRKIVSYILTEKGAEFHNILGQIKRWNIKWNKVPEFCVNMVCSECQKTDTKEHEIRRIR